MDVSEDWAARVDLKEDAVGLAAVSRLAQAPVADFIHQPGEVGQGKPVSLVKCCVRTKEGRVWAGQVCLAAPAISSPRG